MNEDYEPSENEEQILQVMKDGRDRDEPWGYASPNMAKQQSDMNDAEVNYAMNQLIAAGWAERVHKGLYRLKGDPREESDTDE